MRLTRCPRCGKGRLFSGIITIAPACSACGLSFAGHEQGDEQGDDRDHHEQLHDGEAAARGLGRGGGT